MDDRALAARAGLEADELGPRPVDPAAAEVWAEERRGAHGPCDACLAAFLADVSAFLAAFASALAWAFSWAFAYLNAFGVTHTRFGSSVLRGVQFARASW